jgi:glycine oxidase
LLQPNYLTHFMPFMIQPISVDYLIVGQGLAGSAVAMQLLKKGKRILVIDEPENNCSSRPAAGLFNPITGQKTSKTWLADSLFPYLHQYYSEVELVTGKKFFYPMPLYKPFHSVEEQNEWMGKSADELYTPYIDEIATRPRFDGELHNPFGGLLLKQCGYINTVSYLEAVRNYVSIKAHYWNEHFEENELVIGSASVSYRHVQASAVIFCQGISGLSSSRFKALPLRPLKGEIILIKSDWKKHVIPNRGVYMVPGNGPDEYRVGATYQFNDASAGSSDAGRKELEQKLKTLIEVPYTVIGQDWGVRPTTADRRPILGKYPESDRLIIFNGLGTKGVTLAPYFSEVLIHWLENSGSLNKDVALTRFK